MSCCLVLYYMCFSNKHHSNQWHLSMNRAFYTYYNKTNKTKIGGGQKLSECKTLFEKKKLSAAATPYRKFIVYFCLFVLCHSSYIGFSGVLQSYILSCVLSCKTKFCLRCVSSLKILCMVWSTTHATTFIHQSCQSFQQIVDSNLVASQ